MSPYGDSLLEPNSCSMPQAECTSLAVAAFSSPEKVSVSPEAPFKHEYNTANV